MGTRLTAKLTLGRGTRVNLDAVFALLTQAQRLCGHSDYVVIGSLSVLALEADCQIPADMTLSIDVDCYT